MQTGTSGVRLYVLKMICIDTKIKTFCADITFVCAMSVVEVAFASSVVTGDFGDLQAFFHVGDVVIALSVTLMVCGFGIGPLFWSPLVCGHIEFTTYTC